MLHTERPGLPVKAINKYRKLMSCDHIKALELAGAGNWDASHKLVQKYSDKLSCLIHAYLHRVEGDISNARYWYRRAGVDMSGCTLEEELERLHELAGSGKTDSP